MRTTRAILLVFACCCLCSCGGGGTPTPPAQPPTSPPPTPGATSTPLPVDIPVYENSFEGLADPAAGGFSSNGTLSLNAVNFNYPGPGIALEISGTLPGEQYSSLYVDLPISVLAGVSGLELDNKTIYYAAYLPADSAIDNISVQAGKDGVFTPLAGINADEYRPKGAWHNYRFALAYVPGLSGYYDTIRILGQRNTGGEEVAANFLIDDLRWIGVDVNHIPVDDTVESLRRYTRDLHFVFGLWSDPRNIIGDENDPLLNTPHVVFEDPWVAYLTAQEGSISSIGGFFSGEGEDASLVDPDSPETITREKMFAYGIGNAMTTLGYGVGCTHFEIAQWLHDLTFPQETQEFLLHQIEKDLRFTLGQKPVWILFNEFILTEEYGGNGLKYRQMALQGLNNYDFGSTNYYMPWAASPTDSSLIEAAFIRAHEVDPEATLLLNDGFVEQMGRPRSDFLFEFASDLKDKGIPIDGVGFQAHVLIDPDGGILHYIPFSWPWQFESWDMDGFLSRVDQNVKRYAGAGLKVAFTEVNAYIRIDDLDLTLPADRVTYEARLEWQAKYYAGMFKIALENENVILYQSWGVTDRWPDATSSMFPGYGDMELFDKNFYPKPAYEAMLELLRNR